MTTDIHSPEAHQPASPTATIYEHVEALNLPQPGIVRFMGGILATTAQTAYRLGRSFERGNQRREAIIAEFTATVDHVAPSFEEDQPSTNEKDTFTAPAPVESTFTRDLTRKAFKAVAETVSRTVLFAIGEKLSDIENPSRKVRAAKWLTRAIATSI